MKWSLLLIIMTCFSLNGAWAEDVQVQEIGLDDTSSFQSEPFEPLGVENEMTLSNEGLGGDSKKESSLIPEQPAVDVVAEPIDYFAPESMRHDRQDQEYSTEQQIAEKLEQDRINAERNRAQEILGRIDGTLESVKPFDDSRWYMMGMFGVSEYDVPNVKSDDSIGFAIGTKVMNQFIVEGSIVFSKYFLEQTMTYNPFFEKIDQYNVGFAVKSPVFEGQIFKGRVLPIVGLIGSYTRRSYKEQSLNGFSQGRQDATTNAFDVGLVAGLDFNVTRNFAIGADYKYMFNLTGGGDSSYYTGRIDFERDDPLEELNYHQISLNGKFKF